MSWACSSVPPFSRKSVIPVARNVCLPIGAGAGRIAIGAQCLGEGMMARHDMCLLSLCSRRVMLLRLLALRPYSLLRGVGLVPVYRPPSNPLGLAHDRRPVIPDPGDRRWLWRELIRRRTVRQIILACHRSRRPLPLSCVIRADAVVRCLSTVRGRSLLVPCPLRVVLLQSPGHAGASGD